MELHKKLIDSDFELYVITTGGGQSLFSHLLNEGGASAYFTGMQVPYAKKQTDKLIKGTVEKYNSMELAEKFAIEAFQRVNMDNYGRKNKIAIGVTCSLYSEGQREDRENSAYIWIKYFREGKGINTVCEKVTLTGGTSRLLQETCLAGKIGCMIEDIILC